MVNGYFRFFHFSLWPPLSVKHHTRFYYLIIPENTRFDRQPGGKSHFNRFFRPGNRTLTLHDPSCIKTDKSPKPLTVDRDGFSLNAAVSCKPYQRERLERLCRYITRPAICLDRLNVKKIPFAMAPHISCFHLLIFLTNWQH